MLEQLYWTIISLIKKYEFSTERFKIQIYIIINTIKKFKYEFTYYVRSKLTPRKSETPYFFEVSKIHQVKIC